MGRAGPPGSRRLAEDVRSAGTKPPAPGPAGAPRRRPVGARGDRPPRGPWRGRPGQDQSAPAAGRADGRIGVHAPAGARPATTRATSWRRAAGPERAAQARGPAEGGQPGLRAGPVPRRPADAAARSSNEAPGAASARELLGLTHYRLGQWNAAIKELEAFRSLTGSTEQHPVLADCYRAQKRWARVDELWEELRAASPSADLVAEGRIVVAGGLADRGRLAEAIATLEPAVKVVKRPRPHHLRMAYALADLRERSGDVPGARDLFEWVARHDPSWPTPPTAPRLA